LGVGGFGVVYLAHEANDSSKKVAIKLLQSRGTHQEDSIARQAFLNEIVNMASLCQQQSGIVEVYNTIMNMTPDGVQLGVVMEYVSGVSLFDYIKKQGKMVHTRAIPIILQILKILGFAHHKGVIHRDIKPENIMVVTDQLLRSGALESHPVKIMDFGLSKAFEGATTMESTGWGSGIYMAPERVRGKGEMIDATSDLYSVGVMFYVMLTGDYPFNITSSDPLTAVRLITTATIPSVRGSYEYHPADLDRVIGKAMAKTPAERYQTCEEMARDLAALLPGSKDFMRDDLRGEPGSRRPPVAQEPQAREVPVTSGKKGLAVAGAIAAAAIIAGGLWFAAKNNDAKKPEAQSQASQAGRDPKSAPTGGVKTSAVTSLNELAKDAQAGDVKAQFTLGMRYYEGKDVQRDNHQAFNWLLKAAENGEKDAQFNIAAMYEQGIGTEPNIIEAEKWYKKSAGQGDPDAMYQVGIFFQKRNKLDEALYWFEKAEKNDLSKAQFSIGRIYEQKRDFNKALEWYIKAATNGVPAAQSNLGILYIDGSLGSRSYEDGAKWLLKAANSGDMYAQYNIAMLYKDGKGVQKNTQEAIMWFTKSASQGNTAAYKEIDVLEKHK